MYMYMYIYIYIYIYLLIIILIYIYTNNNNKTSIAPEAHSDKRIDQCQSNRYKLWLSAGGLIHQGATVDRCIRYILTDGAIYNIYIYMSPTKSRSSCALRPTKQFI